LKGRAADPGSSVRMLLRIRTFRSKLRLGGNSMSDIRTAASPAMANPARQHMIYDANRKSTGVAYLLWFFLGGFGAHRFYLGQTGTAVTQLLLALLGWIPMFVGWFALGIWLFVDLFLIPGIAREQNMRLADRLTLGSARI
jgi:TM2 domain-containing membrane protein YozV